VPEARGESRPASLRTAVVGVVHLGRHHARLLAAMPGVELVAVVDTAPGRAAEIAGQHGGEALTDWRALRGRVDAVVVAVPTESHAEVAVGCLDAGAAVLVEKPLAFSLADADRIVVAARRAGVVCAAGHSERFNPAVTAALPLITDPRFVEIHRLGAFPDRSLDVDVIFDLMIHDLDLLLAAVRSEVVGVEAVGVHVLTPKTDIANARLKFASGCIANLTASRISRDRVRKARFFQSQSYVSIDFAAREVEMYRLVPGEGRPSIGGGRLEVPHDEPLRREL
jgi:predicted dehydrogenase